jgi:hypothetical protein
MSVIGVVLAGVSLGNYLGGRVADRWPSRSALALVYSAGSLASVAILVLVRYVESLQLPSEAPAVVQVLWLTTVLFFVPSTCVLREMPAAERFDFVLGDAFDDVEVPYHLTTRQFNDLVAQHLKPDGLYLANVIDSFHFDFLRSELRRLRLTFPYVALMAQRGDWPPVSGQRGTYVAGGREARTASGAAGLTGAAGG